MTYFYTIGTGTQTITAGSGTQLSTYWNSPTTTSGNLSYNVNGSVTVSTPGYYYITASVNMNPISLIWVTINSTSRRGLSMNGNCSNTLLLNANDVISIYAYNPTSGTALGNQPYGYFGVFLI
jgi:hypothetical protein